VRRLEAAKGKYAEGAFLDYRLVQEPGGRFSLAWQFDAGALERWQYLEGVPVESGTPLPWTNRVTPRPGSAHRGKGMANTCPV
jgi:hypothetical protein